MKRFGCRYWGWRGRSSVCPGVGVDVMLEADPCYESRTENEIEQPFVGYGKDDEDRRKGQEQDDQAMEIMAVWLEAVEKR